MTTQIKFDTDSSLAQALADSWRSGKENFIVLKDDTGEVKWSGVINQFSIDFAGTTSVDLDLTQEWLDGKIREFRDLVDLKAKQAGIA